MDQGQGDPILFLHGNPTSSYLWRNVMPHVEPQGRVIALDLIGMGASDKPDIDYTYDDHIRYVEAFIDALNLQNITLVIHDWGSALGFDYASRHENNVSGMAFMEAIVPPFAPIPSYDAMGALGQMFRAWRTPRTGERLILEQNQFMEQILGGTAVARESVFVGQGIHFIQEDQPEIIGRAIADWRRRNIR